ncbi:cupin domain-containing protein [Acidisoma cellulosilytica]|uniref:Cupin domain-containing protein n=1 Tax=Acidisoma cellulosilyticum TaxID=2802395 RepID=A0A963Z3Y4_9PROT|nr:AraC family transcriptional regulator [Acidisoma cellulosilyticum]MCB8882081.1 cupin domain-containing protein [Acidisoma cellulosilyticum]
MATEADIFEELTPLLRVRPELQAICRFGAQWASPHAPEPEGWAPFHIVTAGQCRLEMPGAAPLTLTAGDVAVLPHGGPHTIRTASAPHELSPPMRSLSRPFDGIMIKTNVETDVETGLICGRFQFEQANHNTVLAALPPIVVVPAATGKNAGRIASLVTTMQTELLDDRPGAAAVATALALAVMVIVLRAHLEAAAPQQGVLALLARPQTAKALLGMLKDPARPWTLDDLAEQGHTSRATLVRQFQAAVNMAPVAFLAELRLTLARGRIRASRTALAVIAEDVGYQSETAFSRAYQRQFGVPPSGDRSAM